MTISNNDPKVDEYRTVSDGPTVEEILSAVDTLSKFSKYGFPVVTTDNGYSLDEVKEYGDATNILLWNQVHLANQGTTNINKSNLMKLIQTILSNGKSFDMSSFLSSRKFSSTIDYGTEVLLENQAFKCDTIGCIAGFATAIATDWKLDPKFTSSGEMMKNGYLHIACKYLNIPTLVGRNIFYGDEDSIWAFIKIMMENNVVLSGYFNRIDWYVDDSDNYESNIELSTIDYNAAAELLRMIHDDELLFDEDYLPYFAPSVGGNY
jgi:hypothetical protein